MTTIKSLKSLILDLPPSCIEFWPVDPQYAVVGTYNLDRTSESGVASTKEESEDPEKKKSQKRDGSVLLVKVVGDNVEIIDTVATPSAILDIHFAPGHFPPSCFGVATSTGSIDLYYLGNEHGDKLTGVPGPSITPKVYGWKSFQFFADDLLVTAFQWSSTGKTVTMTLTSGEVCLRTIGAGTDDIENMAAADLGQHDLEAWTLAYLPDGSGVLSGGDDSTLRYWGVSINSLESKATAVDEDNDGSMAIGWTDRKIHGAGVTAILPLSVADQSALILTGSYDDHIRLIRAPQAGRRFVLAELNLGGGVWRLKRLDAGPDFTEVLLLASCMHAGTRILRLTGEGDEWNFEVLAKFEEHQSMNYGSDSQPDVGESGQRTFVTTSFYDRLLCLWRY